MPWHVITNDPCDNSCPNDADQVMANFAYRLESMLPLNNVGTETGDTYNLGSDAKKWKHGYFSEEIFTPCIPPIGSIIPFYDFDGGLTFDSNYWAYCDGSSKTVGGIGVQTLPDLSNRYLVGFGTEGGGDIDSAAWATAAVGNASHQIDIQHSHTVDSHTHSLSSHTHTGPSHSHTVDSHSHTIDHTHGATGAIHTFNTAAPDAYIDTYSGSSGNASPGTSSDGTGATGPPSNDTSGSASPGTDNQLSTTQSIQPRSIRVRFIMRIK